MKIDDLALKNRPFYRQENRLFFHNYAILLEFDIFQKSYVIVQEIPSSFSYSIGRNHVSSGGTFLFGASEGSA